jgi:hypothetical protein
MKRCAILVVAGLILWSIAALPTRLWWGHAAFVESALALAICMVPALASLAWAAWRPPQTDQQRLVLVLGGTSLRLLGTLALALVLLRLMPELGDHMGFWTWVVIFYLFMLAFETSLLASSLAVKSSMPPKAT